MKIIDNRWKIGEALGGGGQANIYVVRDINEEFSGMYAIKILRNDQSAQAYERFRKEISALLRTNHPNIIKIIHHSNEKSDSQYYVMEYVRGFKTLKKLILEDTNYFKKDAGACADLFLQIANALDYCERMDPPIIHRDLSPANILVFPDKRIKIIDFGLCQIEGTKVITLTDEGVGTRYFMAPECERGGVGKGTIASDLYSAGKIVWSAVTSKIAFARESFVFDDKSMMKMFPDQQELWHLQRIFEKTIRYDPINRWNSAWTAKSYAQNLRELINSGKPPLEAIWDSCPICGIGKLERILKPQNIFHGIPDGFLAEECNNCGFSYLRNNKKYSLNVDATKGLA